MSLGVILNQSLVKVHLTGRTYSGKWRLGMHSAFICNYSYDMYITHCFV